MTKWEIIKAPIITEKSNQEIENFNQYSFKVAKEANKIEIKNAVEEIFNVHVLEVKTVNVLPKRRRVGRYEGFRPAYKKAICRLAKGEKIDAFNI
jgi:large subunit ribosomal protein L23